MDAEFFLKIIQLIGFPAAMCLWFMLRLEKKLDSIEETNHKQVVVMAVLVRLLGDKKSTGTIPEEVFDSVTGVTDIPVPAELEAIAPSPASKKRDQRLKQPPPPPLKEEKERSTP